MSSLGKLRTSDINTTGDFPNVLVHIKCPFLERRSSLWLQGPRVWFRSPIFILSSHFPVFLKRIMSSYFKPRFGYHLCGTYIEVSHLIIFNYGSLQSCEKNVRQTSSTMFLFLADGHGERDRWETSLMCVYFLRRVQSGYQGLVPFN